MTAFEQIVIGKSSIPALILTVVLAAAIPMSCFLYWRRKQKEHTTIRYLLAGAVGFLVSARMLELGVHDLCILSDNPVSRFLNGSTAAYVLYGTVTAGVFEEYGRHVVLKYILKQNRTRENAVLYGIGHGGAEILAVLLPTLITYLVIAVLFSQGNVEQALSTLKITEQTASAAFPTVQAAAAFDFGMMAMNVVERLLAMLLQIGLTVVVFSGVVQAQKGCLPLAIVLHMLADTFPALYQRGALPLWAVELWIAGWTVVALLISGRLYGKLRAPSSAGHA